MKTAAIIVAGGVGSRFGEYPKQFEVLGGKTVISYSVETAVSTVDQVVVVLPEDYLDQYSTILKEMGVNKVVPGGHSRSESVRHGLKEVDIKVEEVLVHDAARPLATKRLFEIVLSKLNGGEKGVIPVIEISDTVKRVSKGYVDLTLDRSTLALVQTPQGFDRKVLTLAHESFGDATDDSTLVELLGYNVAVVPGEPENIKITKPIDLKVADILLQRIVAKDKSR